MAGDGGFDITVKGNTDLKGAIIASTDKAVQDGNNRLTTGSLTTSDLLNTSHASSKGSSISLGGGINSNGKPTASPPLALSGKDSTSDSSITVSGISGGVITITNEEEQLKRTGQTAQEAIDAINDHVQTGMSTGGIEKTWDTGKMVDEMQANLEIGQAFTQAANDFVGNRVKELTNLQKDLKEAQEKKERGEYVDPDYLTQLQTQINEKEKLWGMGGNGRLVVTAITAALGGNVSGNTADLVQNAAIGFLQGKGAHAIKDYVDKYHGGDDSIRAALQGVLGCAGSAATGGDCSSAAVGAAGSVLINKIMGGTTVKDPVTGKDREMTLEEKQDRENLVNSILTGTVAALGGDAAAANTAAKIEMENNQFASNQIIGGDKILKTGATPGEIIKDHGCTSETGYCVVINRDAQDEYGILNSVDWYEVHPITEDEYGELLAQGKVPPRNTEELGTTGNVLFDNGLSMPTFSSALGALLIGSGAVDHPLRELSDDEKKGFLIQGVFDTVSGVVWAKMSFRFTPYKKWSVDPSTKQADQKGKVLIDGAYKNNPTAQNLSDLLTDTNKVGGKNMNGQYMYVVDLDGNIIIGTRSGERMPHPTLIGGEDPKVLGAGIVEIRGGKIYSIDNASGHYKPGAGSLDASKDAFRKLPNQYFSKDFQGYKQYDK